MACLGWELNLGFAASDSGAAAVIRHLQLLGIGRCWWWWWVGAAIVGGAT